MTTSHALRRVPVLRAVHAHRPAVDPVGEVERDEVVDHRRADAAALRRIHPVAEVEDVEGADDASPPAARRARDQAVRSACAAGTTGRRRSAATPSSDASIVRRPARDAGAKATTSCRAGLREPEQRSADVVADARPRMRQGRDVDDDPHGV